MAIVNLPPLITLLIFKLLVSFHPTQAQNSPADYLRAHNQARAQVGVGPMTWDANVAAYAQRYANSRRDCQLIHSSGPYGENLAMGMPDLTAVAAVKMWVDERQFYNCGANRCVGNQCLHYTQVVWQSSTRLGCARVKCNNGRGTFVICSYAPRGNIVGRRPYPRCFSPNEDVIAGVTSY